MSGSRLARALLLAVMVGAGGYLFVYLYRWEWNRATIAGIFLVAAEVAHATILVTERVAQLAIAPAGRGTVEIGTLARLRETAPRPRQRFAWLTPTSGQTSVFVPVLMGAGVVLSGLAWLVERIAQHTARPRLERGLARRLDALAIDAVAGLVPPPGGEEQLSAVDLLSRPRARSVEAASR